MDCSVWSSCVVVVSMCICALKSLAGLFPASAYDVAETFGRSSEHTY